MAAEGRKVKPHACGSSAARVGEAVRDRGNQEASAPQIIVIPATTIIASRIPE